MCIKIDYENKGFNGFIYNGAERLKDVNSFKDLKVYLKKNNLKRELKLLERVLGKIDFNSSLLRVFMLKNDYIFVEYDVYLGFDYTIECSFVLRSSEAIIFPYVIF